MMLLGLEAAGGRDAVIPSSLHFVPLLSLRLKREPRIQCVEIHADLPCGVEFEASGLPAPLGLRCQ